MRQNYEQFVLTFIPEINTVNPNENFDGCYFETFGDDLVVVQRTDPNRVFTIVQTEGGKLYAIPGKHQVNRYGYFIVAHPWTPAEKDLTFNLSSKS